MPNKKSAERRARVSQRKHLHNQTIKSRLKTLERTFKTQVEEGKKEEAGKALIAVTSALDKAAKSGVVHRATANRRKSRLSTRLSALKA